MLIEFTVENFRSFRSAATLSFLATDLVERSPSLNDGPIRQLSSDVSVLTSAIVLGANASGKSNLCLALATLRRLVLDSARGQVGDLLPIEPFLYNSTTRGAPTRFEVVFFHGGVQYRYGVELDSQRVHAEWLYRRKQREVLLFERRLQYVQVSRSFSKDPVLDTPPRENALLLSEGAQRGVAGFQHVLLWFGSLFIANGLGMNSSFTAKSLKDPLFGGRITDLIRAFDLGVREVRAVEVAIRNEDLPPGLSDELVQLALGSSRLELKTIRPILDPEGNVVGTAELDFDHAESEGTKKLFALAGPILHTLETGRILVIDEFDSRLHPLMSQHLLGLFQNPTTNPKGAQLLVVAQDEALMDRGRCRRDQVWFVEKDRKDESHLFSLASFKVRNDASYAQDYMIGRYGAVPSLGRLERIVAGAVGPQTGEVVLLMDPRGGNRE